MRDLVSACVVQLCKLQLQEGGPANNAGEPQHVVRQLWQGTSVINTHTQHDSTAGTAGSPQAKAVGGVLSITNVLPQGLRQCVKAVGAFDLHWPLNSQESRPASHWCKEPSDVRGRLSANVAQDTSPVPGPASH